MADSRLIAGSRRRARLAGAVLAVLVAGALASGGATGAAFRATTTNASDRIVAGTVKLTDDSGGTLLSVSSLRPGEAGAACIAVTYGGSLAAAVKLYVAASGGAAAPYLDLVVEEGGGGSASSCSGFTASATLYNGTFAGFAASSTSYATGVGSWAPSGSGQSRVYRVRYALSPATPGSIQSTTATATLRWEARNT